MKPAIVAVGYNRPNSLKRLLDSICNASYDSDDVTLIISIDKADNEKEVLKVANDCQWTRGEKVIRTFNERQGLRKHIIQCGDLSNKYGAVIILEDDLIVSPGFYSYVLEAIDFYKDSKNITGIALYSHEWNGYAYKFFSPLVDQYDTYLGQFSITWGQCWTYDWWKLFKEWYSLHEDKLVHNDLIPENINNWSVQSWGKYFVNYIVERNLYYVIPRVSLTTNCSEVGQHAKRHDSDHQVRLLFDNKIGYRFAPVENALKYDIFFESQNLSTELKQYEKDGICIDLAAYGRKDITKRYLLSTNYLPYKIEKSYGLEFRPAEQNIIMNVSGTGIFLYDTTVSSKNPKNCYLNIRYELRGLRNRELIKYVMHVVAQKIRRE